MGTRAVSRKKVYAFGIDAGHDTNGNPRRGWLVYAASDGHFQGFVVEGYRGRWALTEAFPNVVELMNRFPTTPGTYRDLMRGD